MLASLGLGFSNDLPGRDNIYLTGGLIGMSEEEIADKEQTLLNYLASNSESIEDLKKALFVDYIEDLEDDISVLLLSKGG